MIRRNTLIEKVAFDLAELGREYGKRKKLTALEAKIRTSNEKRADTETRGNKSDAHGNPPISDHPLHSVDQQSEEKQVAYLDSIDNDPHQDRISVSFALSHGNCG